MADDSKYIAPPVGNFISATLLGIKPELLLDNARLKDIFLEALEIDGFSILEVSEYNFNPGYTITATLAESHAAMHTYPEYNSIQWQLYTCRGPEDGRNAYRFVRDSIKPEDEDFFERQIPVESEALKKIRQAAAAAARM